MRNFLFSVILLIGIGGFAVVRVHGNGFLWQDDLKRPEVQRALNQYLREHCEIDIFYHDLTPQQGTGDNSYLRVPTILRCWEDSPAK